MNSYHALQALYYLGHTLITAFIMGLDCLMFLQARRKRLTTFLRCLVPATVGASLALAVMLLDDLVFLFGLHRTWPIFLMEFGLGLSAGLFGVVSVFWLWRVVSETPPVAEAARPYDQPAVGQPGVWPPPPTGAA